MIIAMMWNLLTGSPNLSFATRLFPVANCCGGKGNLAGHELYVGRDSLCAGGGRRQWVKMKLM